MSKGTSITEVSFHDTPVIPVTYQCWGCGSETTIREKSDLPIVPNPQWNLCKECQNKERGGK